MTLEEKEQKARELIKEHFQPRNSYVAHSGGKDSSAILELTRQIFGDSIKVIHNTKPITDPNYVPTHDENYLTNYVMPKYPNYMSTPQVNMLMTTRRLKLTTQVDGSRREEFNREDKSTSFIMKGKNHPRDEMPELIEDGIFGLKIINPILDWSYTEVFDFLKKYKVEVSMSYLDDEEYNNWRMKG